MTNQHKYGQHYTPEIITNKYTEFFKYLKENKLAVVDPFVGEGNLLIDYLNIFSKEEAIQFIYDKKIKGYDIDPNNIKKIRLRFKELFGIEDKILNSIFKVNNSLQKNPCRKKDIIITNPPYLSRNTCKTKYPEDYNINFYHNKFSDYYELALNLYKQHEGLWIIPANFISSTFLANTRKSLMNHKTIEHMFVFEIPVFEHTDISVVSFLLKNKNNIKTKQLNLDINFVKFNYIFKQEIIISKNIDIDSKGHICSEWFNITKNSNLNTVTQGLLRENLIPGDISCIIINENYEPETIYINQDNYQLLQSNFLYIRTTDTGTPKGMLGIYLLEEIFPDLFKDEIKPISLLTKDSSRLYTPIFFTQTVNYEDQLYIKNQVNILLNEYRDKYNSIFLTNFKNATKTISRKRITFKEIYGLIEYVINNKKAP